MTISAKPLHRRIAHLWTPLGLADVLITGDWPALLQVGQFVYRPDLARDLTPLTTRGRYTGAEFLLYRTRFDAARLTDAERARVVHAEKTKAYGYRQCPSPDRTSEVRAAADERRDVPGRKRAHLRKRA